MKKSLDITLDPSYNLLCEMVFNRILTGDGVRDMAVSSIEKADLSKLSKQIEEKVARKKGHPSDDEARKLIEKFRNGDQAAFNQLVERNQRLVISIAEKYSKNPDFVLDLIQEGNMGLIRAIQKFNMKGKVNLSTYASIWIRSNIETYISKSAYSFKVSQNSRKKAFKAFKMHERLSKEDRSEHEIISEIARELDIDSNSAMKLVALKNASVNMQDRRYQNSEDGSQTIQDTMASDVSVEASVEKDKLKNMVNKMIKDLPEKQKEAVSLFYGLNNHPECDSFSQIAKHMNITREYARILHGKAMALIGDKIKEKGTGKIERLIA